MADPHRYVKEIFFSKPNLVLLGLGALFALVAGSIALGAVVLGVEMASVYTLSKSDWYQRRVRNKKGWGGYTLTVRQREKLSSALDESSANRYAAFRQKYRSICKRVEADLIDDPLVEAAVQKLETLSDAFLRLLGTQQRTDALIGEENTTQLAQQLEEAKRRADQADGQVKELRAQNAQILQDRIDQIDRAKENHGLIVEQLKVIEAGIDVLHDRIMVLDGITEIGSQVDLMLTNLQDAEQRALEMDSLVLSATPIDSSVPESLRKRRRV